VLVALAVGCADADQPPGREIAASCEAPAVRQTVEDFGTRLRQVSLLAPEEALREEITRSYQPFVTPSLLQRWLEDPAGAPGRLASSPWPARIEIVSVEPAEEGACLVVGEVVEVTSADTVGGTDAPRETVRLTLVEEDRWRIAEYEPTADQTAQAPSFDGVDPTDSLVSEPSEAEDQRAAADVIRRYYEAIDAGDYRAAYALWSGGGEASGQSYEEFAAGFAETDRVEVTLGEPSRVEPAAGSRYVEIPVTIEATTRAGERQRFEGVYTLRRAVVPGATEEQRSWRIASADIEELR